MVIFENIMLGLHSLPGIVITSLPVVEYEGSFILNTEHYDKMNI